MKRDINYYIQSDGRKVRGYYRRRHKYYGLYTMLPIFEILSFWGNEFIGL